jgi:thiol-disulfide isomerase/thioredoxin
MVTKRAYSIFTKIIFVVSLITNVEASSNLFKGSVEDLKTGKIIDLKTFRGKPAIITFFQSGCERCHQQVKIFECLNELYPQKFNIIYLGIFSEKKKLVRTIEDYKIPNPAYYASESYLKNVGGIKYTPFTLISDENGESRGKFGGSLPCKKLEDYLKLQKVI